MGFARRMETVSVDPREPVRLTFGERVGLWTALHPWATRAILVVLGASLGALAGKLIR